MKVYESITWDWNSGELLEERAADYDGPVLHLKGGSQTTINSGTSAPWTAQQSYLTSGFQQAAQNYASSNPSYYPNSTVVPFDPLTNQGMGMAQNVASNSTLPNTAASNLSATLNGTFQKDPASWAAQLYNPQSSLINPNANAQATANYNPNAGAYNSNAGITNPNAGVMASTAYNQNAGATNPYLGQDPNAYIGNLTTSIANRVMAPIMGNYAISGRTGTSPMAQEAMAQGISDSLAPYAFNSAEAAQQRQFNAGQTLQAQQYGAGEQQAGAQNAAGAQQAQNLYGAGSQQLANLYGAGQQQAQNIYGAGQQYSSAQDAASQQQVANQYGAGAQQVGNMFTGGENAFNRGLAAYDAERNNQMQGLGLAGQTQSNLYQPSQALMGLGSMNEDLAQRNLQDAINRWNFDQNLPQQKLSDYMGLISGNYGQQSTGQSYGSVSSK